MVITAETPVKFDRKKLKDKSCILFGLIEKKIKILIKKFETE